MNKEQNIEKIMVNKLENIFINSDMPNSKKVIRETRELLKEAITQARQEERERLIEMVKTMDQEFPSTNFNDGGDSEYRFSRETLDSKTTSSYNQALSDIINKIKEN